VLTTLTRDKNAPLKFVRVRVLRGFQCYATLDEINKAELPVPEHLPGAVIDLQEEVARAEFHIKRCVEVDPSTPLRDGDQPVSTSTRDEDARDEATLARAEAEIDARIERAVAAALAKAKK
jgi:hypothetical protein